MKKISIIPLPQHTTIVLVYALFVFCMYKYMLKIRCQIGSVGIIERVQGISGDEFGSGFATHQYDL